MQQLVSCSVSRLFFTARLFRTVVASVGGRTGYELCASRRYERLEAAVLCWWGERGSDFGDLVRWPVCGYDLWRGLGCFELCCVIMKC